MRLISSGLVIALTMVGITAAIEPEATIISQPASPLTITSYVAAYQEGGRYTTKGIRHAVEYTNQSDKSIVAVQIGLVSFDVWNEFLDRTGGVSLVDMAPGGEAKGTWVARSFADFSFLTGVAYVGKVRFADGTIWAADLDDIAEQLKKVEKDFDITKLKGTQDK